MLAISFYLLLVMSGHIIYAKQQETIRTDAELLSEEEIFDYAVIDGPSQLWMSDLLILGTLFPEINATLRATIVDENGSCKGQWGYQKDQVVIAEKDFLDVCSERDLDDAKPYLINLEWEKVRQAIRRNKSVDLPESPLKTGRTFYYTDSQIFIHHLRYQDFGQFIDGVGVALPNGKCLVFEPIVRTCSDC
ncbi:hypothetical protein ACFL1U_03360 [Patescibacteria group bacterium]